MATLAQRIRKAAEKEGLGLEAYRRKHGLPNTTFYALLRGRLPAKVRTRESVAAQLRKAGVRVSLDSLAA